MKIKNIDSTAVNLTDGFWAERFRINADTAIYNIYNRFDETGRFAALDCAVREKRSHVFWDSDAAKWIESAAYILAKRPDAKLKALADGLIGVIVANRLPNGYYNSYFQTYEKENIFQKRTEHELYCAGHLIEAAVAYFEATGERALLNAMIDYADLIDKAFRIDRSAGFVTCGHPEIELALIRLYKTTKNKKYLQLADFFVHQRGKRVEEVYQFTHNEYDQSHIPPVQQRTAEGHAVRALYLYAAMADLAHERNDAALKTACLALYENVTEKRMYITGACGSAYHGEAFTFDYDLPNASAYAETCAGIALAFFCRRLSILDGSPRYHDTIERVLYNNILAGQSFDGKSFFYVNPLEAHKKDVDFNNTLKTKLPAPLLERVEVFDCSCCPPNLTRLIADVGGYVFQTDSKAIRINQYIACQAEINNTKIEMNSDMPYGGKAAIKVLGASCTLALRIPSWCGGKFTIDRPYKVRSGYIILTNVSDETINVEFCVIPRFVYANSGVWQNAGRKAITLGSLVMCAESADNPDFMLSNVIISNLKNARQKCVTIDGTSIAALETDAQIIVSGKELYSYSKPKLKSCTVTLIPYFAWANRGAGDMQIWFL